MTKYFEHDRRLYQFVESSGDCDGCAFFDLSNAAGTEPCGSSQSTQDCSSPNGHWVLAGEKLDPPATKCGKCEHQAVAGDQEPCKSCAFDPAVPKGYYPKFQATTRAEPVVGAITAQHQARRVPEIPDGPGWTDHKGGMLPCSRHQYVDVQFRDGDGGTFLAGNADWEHRGQDSDIVRWRPVQPARNGREAEVIPIAPAEDPPEDKTVVVDARAFVGQPFVTPAVVAHPAPDLSSKPTNPKDIIGIRKAPLSCLPMNVVAELGTALLEGASKYGRHNFRGVGVRSSVYFDATMRHLISYWEGEDIDPDSGMSHLTKAMASLAVWRDAQLQGKCTDDRPPRSLPFYPELNERAGAILDRHADKAPRHWTIADSESPTAS